MHDTAQSKGLVQRLKKIPTPLGGLALGIASLGAVWGSIMPACQYMPWISAAIAALLLTAIASKFVTSPELLKEELSHPVIGSVLPTCTMATMVIAQSVMEFWPELARSLWVLAVAGHLLLLVAFVRFRLKDFRLQHMVPSWFIPPVGIIVAAVTSKGMGFESLAQGLFLFGLCAYALELPVMLYRLVFAEAIPTAALPTFAVMAAPASLSLAGYLTISSQPGYLLIMILAPLAIFMTAMVYVAFIRLLKLPFSPGYAAFTFPMVIGATALIKLAHLLQADGYLQAYKVVSGIAMAELAIATLMVTYVALRFARHYLQRQPDALKTNPIT
ncbi:TDT family transporter [Spongorhabdus nitratireducens]